jgi:hypothetical protein
MQDIEFVNNLKKEYPIMKSQIGQDIWTLQQLNWKKNGTFVDIGSGPPVNINNTYVLEKEYGWTGVSLDIGGDWCGEGEISTDRYKELWNLERDTPVICQDALKTNFIELFEQYKLPHVIDYLTLDLDPPMTTLRCLIKIPFDKYQFNVITYETDAYRNPKTEKFSREYLAKYGYKLIKTVLKQDDWYVHESVLLDKTNKK